MKIKIYGYLFLEDGTVSKLDPDVMTTDFRDNATDADIWQLVCGTFTAMGIEHFLISYDKIKKGEE